MKFFNRQKGTRTEEIATNDLKAKGFKILETNFHARFGEIDIIATKGEEIVFVEVKSKHKSSPGTPEEMINIGKIKKIMRTAEWYLMDNPRIRKNFPIQRVDVVAIIFEDLQESVVRLTHYENVSDQI